MKPKIYSSPGFTLVEMLLSLVLFAVVSLSVLQLIQKTVESMKSTSEIEEGLASARLAVQRMQYELVRLKTTDIVSIASSKIAFNDASATLTSFEFDSASGELRRESNALFAKAQSLQLSYLDQSGNAISGIGQIQNLKSIQWTLNLLLTSGSAYSLKGRVFLRSTQYAQFQ